MAILRRHRPRTSLAGTAVLITGAARGIGAELARKAAARGARVALVGLEPEQLARVADELGPEHLWVEADVTDPEALKAAVQRTVDTFGGLDIVVANAGIAPLTTVMTSSAHALARTIEVNLIGAMLTAHAALPAVAERKGHVLLISSAAAFTVLPGMSAYCAAKAGRGAVRRRAAARGRAPRGHRGQRAPDLDRHRHGARHRGRAADVQGDPQAAARARWAPTRRSRPAPRRWWRTWRPAAAGCSCRARSASSRRCARWSPGSWPRRSR